MKLTTQWLLCFSILLVLCLGANNLFKLPFNTYEKMMQALIAKESNEISGEEFKILLVKVLTEEYKASPQRLGIQIKKKNSSRSCFFYAVLKFLYFDNKEDEEIEMFKEIIDDLIVEEKLTVKSKRKFHKLNRYHVENLFKKKTFVYFVEKWKKKMYDTILKYVVNAEKYEKSWLQQPKKYGLTYKNYRKVKNGEAANLNEEVGKFTLDESNEFLNYVEFNLKDIPEDYLLVYDTFLRPSEVDLTRFKFERFIVKVLEALVDEVDKNMLPSLVKELLYEKEPEKLKFSKEDATKYLQKDFLTSYIKKWKFTMFNDAIRLMELRDAEDPVVYTEILKSPAFFGISYENYKLFGGEDAKMNKFKEYEDRLQRSDDEVKEEIEYLTQEFLDAAKEYSESLSDMAADSKASPQEAGKKDEL